MQKIKLALCQNLPGADKDANIGRVLQLIGQAAAQKADLIMLPEMFYYLYELKRLSAVAEADRKTLQILQKAAREYGLYLCTGSMAEKVGEKIYNRAYLLDPDGEVVLEYSKCKLFDIRLPRLIVRESSVFTPGNTFPVVDTPLGRIGILICYDIRFPETARRLVSQGVEIILIPAAFNTITGPAHWHITLRARAVESQCFVAAASPARNPDSTYQTYGHSLVVDPWGTVLVEAGENEEVVCCELDPISLEDTRARLPLLKAMGFQP